MTVNILQIFTAINIKECKNINKYSKFKKFIEVFQKWNRNSKE